MSRKELPPGYGATANTVGVPPSGRVRNPHRATDRTRAAGQPRRGEPDVVARFSAGDISRKQAMRALDITYGELLDRTSERGLALPRVSEDIADRMADTVVQLLDLARPSPRVVLVVPDAGPLISSRSALPDLIRDRASGKRAEIQAPRTRPRSRHCAGLRAH